MKHPIFSALFLFLLPALLVAIIVAVLNFVSLRYVSAQQKEGATQVQLGLNMLDRSIAQVVQLGLLHDNVARQLQQAKSGALDEAAAYRIHVKVVDHLALIQSENDLLHPLMLAAGLSHEQLALLYDDFIRYRNLVLMATDIVAIEPSVAGRYIEDAQTVYFNLAAQTFSLNAQLSDLVNADVVRCQNNIVTQFTNTYWVIVFGVVLALLVALMASRYLSRNLQVLMVEMRKLSLAESIPDRLPAIERLTQTPNAELQRLARAMLGFHQAMKDRDEEKERIYQLAFFDQLTGLPNHLNILALIDAALVARRKDGFQGAVIRLNINRLKVINDGLGYDQGDRLLVLVGQRICQGMGEALTLARESGDEFTLLIENLGQDDLAKTKLLSLMRRIHNLFEMPFELQQQNVFITVVLGATLFPMNESETAEDLLTHAMVALHAAKQLTTEQSQIYFAQMEAASKRRVELETQLRYAIHNEHLQLYLQPQVDATGKTVSFESLVRWQDPKRGLVSPADFISLAEQSDLIVALDRWVLRQACLVLKQLDDAGVCLPIAVNISGKHFAKDFFVNSVLDVVIETGVDPRLLVLEVTEGVFIADLSVVVSKMEQLKAQGIVFSIDDFGTGYSSLQYLKRLPLYELKIDKSFIDGVPKDAQDVALVKTIVSIAQNLSLKVVIEGVETQEQVDFLNALGSFVVQGYFYAKPRPAQEAIRQVLAQQHKPVD